MARVLLIQPNNDRRTGKTRSKPPIPLTLIYIGTAIEDKHQVKIYDRDLNLNDDDFFNLLESYNPDIIGFTFMTSEMIFDFIHLGKLIKKKMPDKIIVAGGVHPTIEPESVLNEPYVDYIIRGEGEEAFLEFCNTFDKNPTNLKNLKNVNLNPLRPFTNLDDLKFPNYNLVNMKEYSDVYVSLGRGCPGNCSFCYSPRMWGHNGHNVVRILSVEKSIEFFKELIEKYKVKIFHIVDDNFVTFKSRAIKICNFLKKYKVNFFCFARADYVDDEILQALKSAGGHTVQIGFESGSQRMLDLLNKRMSVQQNYDAVACCKRNDINCDASFMIGLPTETIEDLRETIRFIKTSKPDVINLKIFSPLPGAPLFDYCIAKGLLKKPKTLEEWAPWTGPMCTISHNVSNIPDETLIKTARELWDVNYYKTKFKRLIFWLKKGEIKLILTRSGTFFKSGKRDIKLPFIGWVNLNKKKDIQPPSM